MLDDNSFKADCEDIHTKTLILNDRDSLRVSAGPARTAAAILEAPPPLFLRTGFLISCLSTFYIMLEILNWAMIGLLFCTWSITHALQNVEINFGPQKA